MKTRCTIAALSIAVMALAAGSAAHASSSLDIYSTPGPDAARVVGEKYGVEIQLRGSLGRKVTFHVAVADGPGARLDAINNLANALNADFVKVYVVTKSDGAPTASALVDSTSRAPFSSTSLSATDAITRIADADYALARIDPNIDGSVTLSAPNLSIAAALNEIAFQTHTAWKAVYILTPRGSQLTDDQKIIGRTANGAPILQMAKIIYDDPARDARQALAAENARKQAEQMRQQALAAQQQGATPAQTAAGRPGATTSTGNGNTPYSGYGYPSNSGQYTGYGATNSYPSAYNNGSGLIVLGNSGSPNPPFVIGSGLR